MKKEDYNHETFTHDETSCSICFKEYQEKDVVSRLKCDERHYFHTHCIESAILTGQILCPFCRAPMYDEKNEVADKDDFEEELVKQFLAMFYID